MSVIVDTSAWSHALRRTTPTDDPQAAKLAELLRQRQPVVLLGVILQELLQGIRESAEFERIRAYLEAFLLIELTRRDYVAAARLGNLCRSKGVQVSIVDSQIAAACIEHDCALLTCDKDFEHIARLCSLRLA